MNSLEAFELIATNCAMNCKKAYHEKCNKNCEVLKAFKAIEKDLEVLEQYKKIEKELRIDLFILFKAVTNGFWQYNPFNQKEIIFAESGNHPYNPCLIIKKEEVFLLEGSGELTLEYTIENYGKTWALTKEELENDK